MGDPLNPVAVQLVDAWSEAVDSYHTADAWRIGKELIPLLIEAKAVDCSSGIAVGCWVYWASMVGGRHEVTRRHVTAP